MKNKRKKMPSDEAFDIFYKNEMSGANREDALRAWNGALTWLTVIAAYKAMRGFAQRGLEPNIGILIEDIGNCLRMGEI